MGTIGNLKSNISSNSYICAVIAIILWGLSFVWTKAILDQNIAIFTFLFIRLSVAGTLLWLFSKISHNLQKVSNKDLLWLLLMAIFEPFIYFIGESYGMLATNSATISAVVIATIPVFCIIVERMIYKVPFTLTKVIGILITLPGIGLVVFEKGNTSVEHLYGIALLFLAVAGATGYGAVVKKVSSKYNSLTIATYQFVLGAILFLPFFIFGGGIEGLDSNFFTIKVLYPLLSLAILCSCLAFVLWINAIRGLGITRANIFSTLIPAISAIAAAFMGQENISLTKILGIAIVICGVILAQKTKKQ